MKLRMQQSVDTLNKLFAETADLSGHLSQFPAATDTPHPYDENSNRYKRPYPTVWGVQQAVCQCREAIIETLGIVQIICRVMLEETGEIRPSVNLPFTGTAEPGTRAVFVSIGESLMTARRAITISADENTFFTGADCYYSFRHGGAPVYERSDRTLSADLLEALVRPYICGTFECPRLRIVSEQENPCTPRPTA